MKNGPYILVLAPDNFPGKKYRGRYAYEHTVVYWRKRGVVPSRGEVIHHINGIKTDNSFSNLRLERASEHSRRHSTTGRTCVELQCAGCGVWFERESRKVHRKQRRSFCSRSHQVSVQQKERWEAFRSVRS